MGKDIGQIAKLPPKTSGFADPQSLVEHQNVEVPTPPSVEPGAPQPPEHNPHSGIFSLWGQGRVYDAPVNAGGIVATMPISRDENGGFVVDFGTAPDGPKLNHPPRIENPGQIASGTWLMCRVVNLANALTYPDPAAKPAEAPPAPATPPAPPKK